jgi:hypothetical protein
MRSAAFNRISSGDRPLGRPRITEDQRALALRLARIFMPYAMKQREETFQRQTKNHSMTHQRMIGCDLLITLLRMPR